MIDEFDRVVGIDKLRCLHLNDSKTAFGSNRDRHENIGDGGIGEDGMRSILGCPALQDLPVILEVPGLEGNGPGPENMARVEAAPRGGPRRALSRAVAPFGVPIGPEVRSPCLAPMCWMMKSGASLGEPSPALSIAVVVVAMFLAPRTSERSALLVVGPGGDRARRRLACLAAAVHTPGRAPARCGRSSRSPVALWAATDATFAVTPDRGHRDPGGQPPRHRLAVVLRPRRAGDDPPLPEAAPRARRPGADRRPDHHGRRRRPSPGSPSSRTRRRRRGRALRDPPRRPLPHPRPALPDHAGLDRAAPQAPCARSGSTGSSRRSASSRPPASPT